MRGAARGLGVAAALLGLACPAAARAPDWGAVFGGSDALLRCARQLDGAQFLEDEPIWICDASHPVPSLPDSPVSHVFVLRGLDDGGDSLWAERAHRGLEIGTRAGELVHSLDLPERPDLHPLDGGRLSGGGLRAGSYDLLAGPWPEARVIARFRVIAPRGSELAVRSALARAARLSASVDTTDHRAAARLYEAVLTRYPNTSYRTTIYAGLWRVRAFSRYAGQEEDWMEEIFAYFHESCFGTWALDMYIRAVKPEQARPTLRKLVGLYPDTPLARAAAGLI